MSILTSSSRSQLFEFRYALDLLYERLTFSDPYATEQAALRRTPLL
jgi:hypothetical protein